MKDLEGDCGTLAAGVAQQYSVWDGAQCSHSFHMQKLMPSIRRRDTPCSAQAGKVEALDALGCLGCREVIREDTTPLESGVPCCTHNLPCRSFGVLLAARLARSRPLTPWLPSTSAPQHRSASLSRSLLRRRRRRWRVTPASEYTAMAPSVHNRWQLVPTNACTAVTRFL